MLSAMCLKRYVGDSIERMDWREEKTEVRKKGLGDSYIHPIMS